MRAASRSARPALLLLAGVWAACGPIVKSAPFRQRPESVKPASVLGGFDGRVIDADSKEPIEGALVWCSWAFTRGVGDAAPEGARSAQTRTNADGVYRLPQLRSFPAGLSTRLTRFSLVIYTKGYVAYRHDRVFGRAAKRRDFSQISNTVKLVRWSPELSHAEHLLFVGSAPALVEASGWEATRAAEQLADRDGQRTRLSHLGDALSSLSAGAPAPKPTVSESSARLLLTSDDVRAVTGFAGAFTRTKLRDAGDANDTLHLRAVDKPERYDVAIRLWRVAEATALEARYDRLLEALPGSKQKDEVGDRSFIVNQGEIRALGFLHRNRTAVVLLTCGAGQCSSADHLLKLSKVIEKNLQRLRATEDNR